MSVAILIPILTRAHRIEPIMQSVAEATPEPHRLLFIATTSQSAVIRRLKLVKADYVAIPPYFNGDYARKINHGFRVTTEPYIFLGADDLKFHPGWFTEAVKYMEDPKVGVVGTQDLGSQKVLAGIHATHFLVKREYVERFGTIDEPGKILHEGYPHEYVDDELIGTARRRNAYAFAGSSVVEHLHPNWGKAPMDETYKKQSSRMAAGKRIYDIRVKLWT